MKGWRGYREKIVCFAHFHHCIFVTWFMTISSYVKVIWTFEMRFKLRSRVEEATAKENFARPFRPLCHSWQSSRPIKQVEQSVSYQLTWSDEKGIVNWNDAQGTWIPYFWKHKDGLSQKKKMTIRRELSHNYCACHLVNRRAQGDSFPLTMSFSILLTRRSHFHA